MIHLLLMLLFIGCACALVWWGFSRLAIPEPIKTLLLVFATHYRPMVMTRTTAAHLRRILEQEGF